jgi:hypothetical protein
MHPDGRESYLRSSLFFCLFFVGHSRENKDAGEGEGEGQVRDRFDTLISIPVAPEWLLTVDCWLLTVDCWL